MRKVDYIFEMSDEELKVFVTEVLERSDDILGNSTYSTFGAVADEVTDDFANDALEKEKQFVLALLLRGLNPMLTALFANAITRYMIGIRWRTQICPDDYNMLTGPVRSAFEKAGVEIKPWY